MKTALEKLCEDYFIELLATNDSLKAIPTRRWDEDDQASVGLVVQAVQGAHRLDGPKGFDVVVTLSYRATAASADDNAVASGAIRDTINRAKTGDTESEAKFGYLNLIDEQMSSSRSVSNNLRKFDTKINLIARIEDV